MKHIRIGSRGSDLALWQANHVKKQLENLGCTVSIEIITTQGDAIQDLSFDKLEGKGFFTKEIEQALLENSIDLAVHSHKDLETNPPAGLIIASVSNRANPADVLLIRKDVVDASDEWYLKENAVVGTSSARRKSQLIGFRPDVVVKDLRGNVPTRIHKLAEGQYDAILLAKAGVERLNLDLSAFQVVELNPEEFIPAPAQGVLGLQIREEDSSLFDVLQKINDKEVQNQIAIERKVLNLLEGGCQLPLGVYCNTSYQVFVSYAKSWEEGASWFEYELEDLEQREFLPEMIVEDLKSTSFEDAE